MDRNNIKIKNNEILSNKPAVSLYDGKLLPIIAFIGLTLPFFLPNALSVLIKPIAIAFILFQARRTKLLWGNTQFLLFFFAFVCLLSIVRSKTTSLSGGIGYELYVVMALFMTSLPYSERCRKRFIKALFFSGVVFSIIVAVQNPLWSINVWNRTYLNILWIRMNSNQIVYVVAIGLSAIPMLIISEGKLIDKWKWYIPSSILMLYVIFLTMSRGGFLCALAISALFAFKIQKSYIKRRPWIVLLEIGVIVAIIILLPRILPPDTYARLLSIDSYSDSNGRLEMFTQAFNNVDNRIFGDGYGAWTSTQKIHNIYINVFVQSGFIGIFIFVILILNVVAKLRTCEEVCILIPMLVQSLVESGDAYTFWVPFIVLCILIRFPNRSNIVSEP